MLASAMCVPDLPTSVKRDVSLLPRFARLNQSSQGSGEAPLALYIRSRGLGHYHVPTNRSRKQQVDSPSSTTLQYIITRCHLRIRREFLRYNCRASIAPLRNIKVPRSIRNEQTKQGYPEVGDQGWREGRVDVPFRLLNSTLVRIPSGAISTYLRTYLLLKRDTIGIEHFCSHVPLHLYLL